MYILSFLYIQNFSGFYTSYCLHICIFLIYILFIYFSCGAFPVSVKKTQTGQQSKLSKNIGGWGESCKQWPNWIFGGCQVWNTPSVLASLFLCVFFPQTGGKGQAVATFKLTMLSTLTAHFSPQVKPIQKKLNIRKRRDKGASTWKQ